MDTRQTGTPFSPQMTIHLAPQGPARAVQDAAETCPEETLAEFVELLRPACQKMELHALRDASSKLLRLASQDLDLRLLPPDIKAVVQAMTPAAWALFQKHGISCGRATHTLTLCRSLPITPELLEGLRQLSGLEHLRVPVPVNWDKEAYPHPVLTVMVRGRTVHVDIDLDLGSLQGENLSGQTLRLERVDLVGDPHNRLNIIVPDKVKVEATRTQRTELNGRAGPTAPRVRPIIEKSRVWCADRQGHVDPRQKPLTLHGAVYFRESDFGSLHGETPLAIQKWTVAENLNGKCGAVEVWAGQGLQGGFGALVGSSEGVTKGTTRQVNDCKILTTLWLDMQVEVHAQRGPRRFDFRQLKRPDTWDENGCTLSDRSLEKRIAVANKAKGDVMIRLSSVGDLGACAIFEPNTFGETVADLLGHLQPGQSKGFHVTTPNHDMGLFLLSRERECDYVVLFYDPNRSLTHQRLATGDNNRFDGDLAELRALPLDHWLEKGLMARYFPSGEPQFGSVFPRTGEAWGAGDTLGGGDDKLASVHVSPETRATNAYLHKAMLEGSAKEVRESVQALVARARRGREAFVLEDTLTLRAAGYKIGPRNDRTLHSDRLRAEAVAAFFVQVAAIPADVLDADAKGRVLRADVNGVDWMDALPPGDRRSYLVSALGEAVRAAPQDAFEHDGRVRLLANLRLDRAPVVPAGRPPVALSASKLGKLNKPVTEVVADGRFTDPLRDGTPAKVLYPDGHWAEFANEQIVFHFHRSPDTVVLDIERGYPPTVKSLRATPLEATGRVEQLVQMKALEPAVLNFGASRRRLF